MLCIVADSDVVAQLYLAGVKWQITHEHTGEGGLTHAVLSDEGYLVATVYLNSLIVYDSAWAIFLSDIAGIEHYLTGWLSGREAQVHSCDIFLLHFDDVHFIELLDE